MFKVLEDWGFRIEVLEFWGLRFGCLEFDVSGFKI